MVRTKTKPKSKSKRRTATRAERNKDEKKFTVYALAHHGAHPHERGSFYVNILAKDQDQAAKRFVKAFYNASFTQAHGLAIPLVIHEANGTLYDNDGALLYNMVTSKPKDKKNKIANVKDEEEQLEEAIKWMFEHPSTKREQHNELINYARVYSELHQPYTMWDGVDNEGLQFYFDTDGNLLSATSASILPQPTSSSAPRGVGVQYGQPEVNAPQGATDVALPSFATTVIKSPPSTPAYIPPSVAATPMPVYVPSVAPSSTIIKTSPTASSAAPPGLLPSVPVSSLSTRPPLPQPVPSRTFPTSEPSFRATPKSPSVFPSTPTMSPLLSETLVAPAEESTVEQSSPGFFGSIASATASFFGSSNAAASTSAQPFFTAEDKSLAEYEAVNGPIASSSAFVSSPFKPTTMSPPSRSFVTATPPPLFLRPTTSSSFTLPPSSSTLPSGLSFEAAQPLVKVSRSPIAEAANEIAQEVVSFVAVPSQEEEEVEAEIQASRSRGLPPSALAERRSTRLLTAEPSGPMTLREADARLANTNGLTDNYDFNLSANGKLKVKYRSAALQPTQKSRGVKVVYRNIYYLGMDERDLGVFEVRVALPNIRLAEVIPNPIARLHTYMSLYRLDNAVNDEKTVIISQSPMNDDQSVGLVPSTIEGNLKKVEQRTLNILTAGTPSRANTSPDVQAALIADRYVALSSAVGAKNGSVLQMKDVVVPEMATGKFATRVIIKLKYNDIVWSFGSSWFTYNEKTNIASRLARFVATTLLVTSNYLMVRLADTIELMRSRALKGRPLPPDEVNDIGFLQALHELVRHTFDMQLFIELPLVSGDDRPSARSSSRGSQAANLDRAYTDVHNFMNKQNSLRVKLVLNTNDGVNQLTLVTV